MKTLILLIVLFASVAAASAQLTPPADKAVPRSDQNSMKAHEQLVEKARKGGIDLYFLGDSITRRWGTSDAQYSAFYENWKRNFFGWNAGNFGWGGDTTQNILWRITNGELDGVNPKVIVLMAGTNNVGSKSPKDAADAESKASDVANGIKAIIDVCRKQAPKATIIVVGIFPRNDNMAVMPVINSINAKIARFANGKKVRFLNVNAKMADKNDKLLPGIAVPDGLHLDVGGYQVWADGLKPLLRKLLGKPAKTDTAPPPTGDPSAAKKP